MPRFGVHEVADVTLYDIVTKKPTLYLNSLKMSTVETEAETSFATGGKGGAKILAWDFNKTAKFNMQNALLDPKAFALQAGLADVTTGVTQVYKREKVTATGTTATLSGTPKTGTQITVYGTTDGVTNGTEFNKVASAPTAGQYSITGSTITLNIADQNSTLIVFYIVDTTASATSINLTASKFPGFYMVVGDTIVRNEITGVDEPFQIIIPKAKLLPGFSLQLQPSGDPTVFDFNMEVYKDGNDSMVQFIKY